MWTVIWTIGFLGVPVAFVGLTVAGIRRRPLKKWAYAIAICAVVFIVGLWNDASTEKQSSQQPIQTPIVEEQPQISVSNPVEIDTLDPTAAESAAVKPTPASVAQISEADYKIQCVDIPYAELVKDKTTYVGTYIQKDFMVRQIVDRKSTGETVYICGENKGGGVYVGGTFEVFDRRIDKTRPIELYDKIYVHGQVTEIVHYMSWDVDYRTPLVDAKYVQFNGKFGQ